MRLHRFSILLAILVTLSCSSGEGDSADRLSVNPESLQCSFSDRKATIEISCSSSWTLNVADEKGAKVTWLTASTVHGVGDAGQNSCGQGVGIIGVCRLFVIFV